MLSEKKIDISGSLYLDGRSGNLNHFVPSYCKKLGKERRLHLYQMLLNGDVW